MPKKVYKSKYTGKVFNTLREVAIHNKKYLTDPEYRYSIKSNNTLNAFDKFNDYIPFIKDKKITLSNAGLSTGAVLSTNMLDSIAKYSEQTGLPLHLAIGLAAKESTLGNPTDDKSIYKILNTKNIAYFKKQGTGQHINPGEDIQTRGLVNYYKDVESDPYHNAYQYALNKSKNNNELKQNLINGESYADRQVNKYIQMYNHPVLFNAFRDFKANPNKYNPGQSNYPQLVEKRGNEVWNSPEVQTWYKEYSKRRRSLEDN